MERSQRLFWPLLLFELIIESYRHRPAVNRSTFVVSIKTTIGSPDGDDAARTVAINFFSPYLNWLRQFSVAMHRSIDLGHFESDETALYCSGRIYQSPLVTVLENKLSDDGGVTLKC